MMFVPRHTASDKRLGDKPGNEAKNREYLGSLVR